MNKHAADSSYLLRLWQVRNEEEQGCRVLLKNICTGEKLGFASLDGLVRYLNQVLAKEINKPIDINHNDVRG